MPRILLFDSDCTCKEYLCLSRLRPNISGKYY